MKKLPLIMIFLLMAFAFSACGFEVNIDAEKGSGNVITETRDVSGFDRVVLSGIGDVQVEQGESESLEIEAEDNLMEYITTEVRDGVLYIGFERKAILPTENIRFNLTMIDVRGLETEGVSNIQADKINTDSLDVSIGGTGNINIDDLSTERLNVTISGAGNFNVEGKAGRQSVKLSGAGNYDGERLESQEADVEINGLGKITVWVTEELDATISGAGNVDYYGNPEVRQQISGLGRLKHEGDK